MNPLKALKKKLYLTHIPVYSQVTENDIDYFLWNSRTTREQLRNNAYGSNILTNAPVKILMHGWSHDITSFWYPFTIDTYVRTGVNVIALDWSSTAQLPLPIATDVARLDALSVHIARFIIGLSQTTGIPFSQIHIIAHSLGAHLAGFTGIFTLYTNTIHSERKLTQHPDCILVSN